VLARVRQYCPGCGSCMAVAGGITAVDRADQRKAKDMAEKVRTAWGEHRIGRTWGRRVHPVVGSQLLRMRRFVRLLALALAVLALAAAPTALVAPAAQALASAGSAGSVTAAGEGAVVASVSAGGRHT